jgi:hypothetical protein
VFACEVGGDTGVSIGGYDAERRAFVFLEFPLRLVGRAADARRHRRLQQLRRELLEQPDRGDRGGVSDPDPALRLSARLGGAGRFAAGSR